MEISNRSQKKLIVSVLIGILFFSCKSKLEGSFIDDSNETIYEFNNSELTLYNLMDSTQQNYNINVKGNLIEFAVNESKAFLNFTLINDSLTIIDENFILSNQPRVKLKQISYSYLPKVNPKEEIFLDTWYMNTDGSILLKVLENDNLGYLYQQLNNSNIDIPMFKERFFVRKFTMFDKYYFYHFQSSTLLDAVYLLDNKNENSLTFRGINIPNMTLEFNRIKPKVNELIFGDWVNACDSKLNLSIPNEQGLVHLGDTITIYKKEMILSHKGKAKPFTCKYDLGPNLDYLHLNGNVLQNDIKIKKLSQDSLILENPYFKQESGVPLLMRYSRAPSLSDENDR